MEILIKALQFILSLSLLIILHELGHFIPAKLFKTKVEKFYLFFDYKFSLFKKKIGETQYGIGWIPLGGYVKIAGMVDESMDTEQLKKPAQPWEFRSKPAWQRLIIMLGGVTVNFLLAWFIYVCLMWSFGESYVVNESLKDGVVARGELAESLGIQTGDKIITIDGQKPRMFREVPMQMVNGSSFKIERNGVVIEKEIPTDFISKLVDKKSLQAVSFLGIRQPFVIGKVAEESVNKNSGLMPKDIVTAISDNSIQYFDQARVLLEKYKGQEVVLSVKRGEELKQIPVKISEEGKIGVLVGALAVSDLEKLGYLKLETKQYSFLQAIPAGTQKTWSTLVGYVKQFKKILNPSTGAYKGLGGFISMGSIFPEQFNWQTFWNITAFLSVVLGFMNLLPVPALDGGHVMFTLWEMITGKKPSQKFLEYAQMIGIVLLLSLLLFANGNDILRHLFK